MRTFVDTFTKLHNACNVCHITQYMAIWVHGMPFVTFNL